MNIQEELECLAFGKPELKPLPPFGLRRKAKGIGAYLKAWHVYRRRGLPGSRRYLESLRRSYRPLETGDSEDQVRLARKGIVALRVAGRIVRETPNCLASSVSLAAGLIALGVDARVVLGKPRAAAEGLPFHAWVEVSGTPIGDWDLTARAHWVLATLPDR